MIQGSQSSDGPNEFGSFMYSECSAQFQAHSVCEKSGVNMQCALRGEEIHTQFQGLMHSKMVFRF